MIIDIHSHPDFLGFNLNRLLQNLEENNIDQTWLLSWEAPVEEFDPVYYNQFNIDADGPASFGKCLKYAEICPDKFILGYAPDPRRPEAIDKLKAAVDVYGVRVYGELKLRMMYDNPDAIRIFHYCGEVGMPVILHNGDGVPTGVSYPRPDYWYGGGMGALERVLQQCPETNIIGHATGFWAYISGDYGDSGKVFYPKGKIAPGGKLPELLRQYENLYCDISAGSGKNALTRDPVFAKGFVTEFQDRILFGRDGEMDNSHQKALEALGLPAETLKKIYRENAQKLLPVLGSSQGSLRF